ncbi:MAG TPA: NAD(P)H-hydrate epimerase [Tepidisphaeraceae bacterium]|nr:NAD(P)H-hydrate epimerase [Tepidisphaeraceae bacterium]
MIRLTRTQARAIDRISIDEFGMPEILLMENAAINATNMIRRRFGNLRNSFDVWCGGGNNGGDGLAIARHLHNAGCSTRVRLASDEFSALASIHLNIIRKMPIEIVEPFDREIEAGAVQIDALLGTGASREVSGKIADAIACINGAALPVVAIDVPSGLDCDLGEPLGSAVRASVTITFVAPKVGFANPNATRYLGEVMIAEIGCPKEAIERAVRE